MTNLVKRLFRWFFILSISLLLASCLLREQWFAAILLLFADVSLAIAVKQENRPWLSRLSHPITRLLLIVIALLGFVGIVQVTTPDSIYANASVRSNILQIYERKMADWPVPYQEHTIDTLYGPVHVIISGEEDKPPLILLHASGVSSWSWKYNVHGLSERYRVYAIDLIGDAGKSEYADLGKVIKTRDEQARHYAEIIIALGIDKAYIVGASEGGFIATNYALHYPERVKRLALIGPMGYSGSVSAIARIALTQLFPFRPLQESTFAWVFSRDPLLQEDFGEWFHLVMSGTTPIKVAPLPFSETERQSLAVSVLFIFGSQDRLVGDPQLAEARVQDIPDVTVHILKAGHLVAAEQPEKVNDLLLNFFSE